MAIPLPAYLFHAVKVVLFVLGWIFFCRFTPGVGNMGAISSWAFEPIAFQKAVLWAVSFR